MKVEDQKLTILLSQYQDKLAHELSTDLLKEEISNLEWNTDLMAAPEFKNVLVTVKGYGEVCIGGRWKGEFFIINDFDQMYMGVNGNVIVTAWRNLPPIYTP